MCAGRGSHGLQQAFTSLMRGEGRALRPFPAHLPLSQHTGQGHPGCPFTGEDTPCFRLHRGLPRVRPTSLGPGSSEARSCWAWGRSPEAHGPQLTGNYWEMTRRERNHRSSSSPEKKEQSLRTELGWPLPEGSREPGKEMGRELPEPLDVQTADFLQTRPSLSEHPSSVQARQLRSGGT